MYIFIIIHKVYCGHQVTEVADSQQNNNIVISDNRDHVTIKIRNLIQTQNHLKIQGKESIPWFSYLFFFFFPDKLDGRLKNWPQIPQHAIAIKPLDAVGVSSVLKKQVPDQRTWGNAGENHDGRTTHKKKGKKLQCTGKLADGPEKVRSKHQPWPFTGDDSGVTLLKP